MEKIKKKICKSTNKEAFLQKELIKRKEEFFVYTNFQTHGRGMTDSTWKSEDDKNILLSLVLYPQFLKPHKQFYFSMIVALTLYEYLEQHSLNCLIKWPNDIIVEKKKIAGILIESEISKSNINFIVAGIGLNLNQTEFSEEYGNPTSLRSETGKTYDKEKVIDDLIKCFKKWYKSLENSEYQYIKDNYISKLLGYRELKVYKQNNKIFEAKIIDIKENGHIVLESKYGKRKEYNIKEIEFVN